MIALLLGVLTLSVGCQEDAPSLQSTVEEMSVEAGTDVVVALYAEQRTDGLDVRVTFLQDDGTPIEFRQPAGEVIRELGSPPLSVPLNGVAMARLDLPSMSQRLTTLPDCDEARAQVSVAGQHIFEHVWCGPGDAPTGRLDGEPVPVTPAGDLPKAAQLLVEDAALLDATRVGRVSITMTSTQVWSTVQVMDPALPRSDSSTCSVLLTRSGGSLFPVCEFPSEHFPAETLDPEVITRIWEAEGKPIRDWKLKLVGKEEPYWLAVSGKRFTAYALNGERS